MKKILGVCLAIGLCSVSFASIRTPKDSLGNTAPTIDWVGALPCAISGSTFTTPVECMTGRGTAYGVIITSPTNVAEYLVLRDSATANTTSSSFTAVGVQPNGGVQSVSGATVIQTFSRPIQFLNGLSANLATAPQAGEIWTILYRPLTATE